MYLENLTMISKIDDLISFFKAHQYEISLGIFGFLLAFVIVKLIKRLNRKYPPGPMGLPIVGYYPFMSEDMFPDLTELGEKYGDVFSLKLGSQNIVVLHGAEVIKEAYNKTEFLGRPPDSALAILNPKSAFFGGNFHAWKEQRRFVVQSMKDLGLGKTKIEEDIMDEINHFIAVLRSHNGEPLDVKQPLSPSISNNICALIFGKRYEYDHPERQFLDKNVEQEFEAASQTSLDTLFPWMQKIPVAKKLVSNPHVENVVKNYTSFFQKKIDEHKKTFDPSNIRDFIDRYLVEIDTQKDKNPDSSFSEEMLRSNVMDVFDAGSETVRTSIHWFVYCMAAFPDVQKKVQQEIMDVLGTEKQPEYMDIKRMPYIHAVILELMRWKSIVPLDVVHYTLADTTVGGYDIPKGTTIIANFWNVHHDPRYWDEPDKFKPERFLSQDGKSVVKSSNFMAFSLGRRVCPGESMANMEMFLYFTSILQKFDIVFPEGTKPTFEAKLKLTYRLEPYLVCFLPKN
ncbi:cytochrome P450 2J2-like [Argiope bruennichi]|uniref:cytochrome P450 2J2-like n=1 Tax=Argiope bruennichi TaxID=94029 RepID=UPI002494381F|nr:cytochrome P450 2J2-like [Argiope bruennichi]